MGESCSSCTVTTARHLPTPAVIQALARTCPVTIRSGKIARRPLPASCNHPYRRTAQQLGRSELLAVPSAAATSKQLGARGLWKVPCVSLPRPIVGSMIWTLCSVIRSMTRRITCASFGMLSPTHLESQERRWRDSCSRKLVLCVLRQDRGGVRSSTVLFPCAANVLFVPVVVLRLFADLPIDKACPFGFLVNDGFKPGFLNDAPVGLTAVRCPPIQVTQPLVPYVDSGSISDPLTTSIVEYRPFHIGQKCLNSGFFLCDTWLIPIWAQSGCSCVSNSRTFARAVHDQSQKGSKPRFCPHVGPYSSQRSESPAS